MRDDDLGCQKEIAKGIGARKADSVLAAKCNQESLHKAIQACLEKLDADPTSLAL